MKASDPNQFEENTRDEMTTHEGKSGHTTGFGDDDESELIEIPDDITQEELDQLLLAGSTPVSDDEMREVFDEFARGIHAFVPSCADWASCLYCGGSADDEFHPRANAARTPVGRVAPTHPWHCSRCGGPFGPLHSLRQAAEVKDGTDRWQ